MPCGVPGKFRFKDYKRASQTWRCMKRRCYNSNHPDYWHYGARGIRVCERWMVFSNFVEDMGDAPPGMSLDRINNDGNYEPGNCRWATRHEQIRNTRQNRLITMNGETMIASDWAALLGIERSIIFHRVRRGWPEKFLLAPVGSKLSQLAARSK